MIQCKDLRKRFDSNEVLKGISFAIPKGSIFGLLGPSGAGKTTLIKIITGQLAYDEGYVRIMDKKPENLNGKDKKNFGIMMDNFGLYERFSCKDNLSVFADIYNVPKSSINEILEEVGLSNASKTQASDLSKGMRARLQLARTFMHSPEILFLDEPTSGLDPQTMRGIHKIILEKKKNGATIFLTTHNMDEAYKLCDNVALLNEGKIVETGKPEDICRRYDHHKKIKMHLQTGEDVVMSRSEESVDEISELLKSGKVETIHSTEPTLETVFLELTGRKLQEED
jgi:ABC-2 type transport system ATP-binding protein